MYYSKNLGKTANLSIFNHLQLIAKLINFDEILM